MIRLTIDLTSEQHQILTAAASSRGLTIERYALERLLPGPDDEAVAWADLKTLLERRIIDGLAETAPNKSIAAILNEELGEHHPPE
jgi:hypothetical protein